MNPANRDAAVTMSHSNAGLLHPDSLGYYKVRRVTTQTAAKLLFKI